MWIYFVLAASCTLTLIWWILANKWRRLALKAMGQLRGMQAVADRGIRINSQALEINAKLIQLNEKLQQMLRERESGEEWKQG